MRNHRQFGGQSNNEKFSVAKQIIIHLLTSFTQGSQIRKICFILRQNCSVYSTEVTEGVTSTPENFR